MPDLLQLLIELRRRVEVDYTAKLAELDDARTDTRFGWQQRGKALRAELAELNELHQAVSTFIEALD